MPYLHVTVASRLHLTPLGSPPLTFLTPPSPHSPPPLIFSVGFSPSQPWHSSRVFCSWTCLGDLLCVLFGQLWLLLAFTAGVFGWLTDILNPLCSDLYSPPFPQSSSYWPASSLYFRLAWRHHTVCPPFAASAVTGGFVLSAIQVQNHPRVLKQKDLSSCKGCRTAATFATLRAVRSQESWLLVPCHTQHSLLTRGGEDYLLSFM